MAHPAHLDGAIFDTRVWREKRVGEFVMAELGMDDRFVHAEHRMVAHRGAAPFDYGFGSEEAVRAGAALVNPFTADADALKRGERVYAITCANCHGADGETKPPAVLRGVVGPPSLLGARAMAMKDGEIFHVITKGQGKMPSHAAIVDPDDRWKAILHVRALQREGTTTRGAAATRPGAATRGGITTR